MARLCWSRPLLCGAGLFFVVVLAGCGGSKAPLPKPNNYPSAGTPPPPPGMLNNPGETKAAPKSAPK
ncbi:MAG: hypothetical protein ACRCZF_21385 [Gemmataceae bacterium]